MHFLKTSPRWFQKWEAKERAGGMRYDVVMGQTEKGQQALLNRSVNGLGSSWKGQSERCEFCVWEVTSIVNCMTSRTGGPSIVKERFYNSLKEKQPQK